MKRHSSVFTDARLPTDQVNAAVPGQHPIQDVVGVRSIPTRGRQAASARDRPAAPPTTVCDGEVASQARSRNASSSGAASLIVWIRSLQDLATIRCRPTGTLLQLAYGGAVYYRPRSARTAGMGAST